MSEKYYKNYTKCKKCGIEYGYDTKEDNGYCPFCDQRKNNFKSRFKNE